VNAFTDKAGVLPVFRKKKLQLSYVILMMAVLVSIVSGIALDANDTIIGLSLYCLILSIICLSPLLIADSFNGRHVILIIYSAFYFTVFGLSDLTAIALYPEEINDNREAIITGAEVVILVGIISFITGYLAFTGIYGDKNRGIFRRDWKQEHALVFSLLFWALGIYITYKWSFEYTEMRGEGSRQITTPFAGVLSLLRYLQPFGTLIMIYLVLFYKSRAALIFLALTLLVDFFFGFVADSKELSLRGLILVLLGVVLIRNRIPYRLSALFIVLIAFSYFFFTVYRLEVLQLPDQSRSQALDDIGSNIQRVLEQGDADMVRKSLEGFLFRITLKPNVELIVEQTGRGPEFRQGDTLMIFLHGFIPRYFWPEKPSTSIGQLFNREFGISADPDTYISTSHIGELYWNYGWIAVVLGMFITGVLLALIATCLRMDVSPSLTKFLLLLMTIYLVCLRFEGGIGQQYTLWFRSFALLMIVHFIIPKQQKPAAISAK